MVSDGFGDGPPSRWSDAEPPGLEAGPDDGRRRVGGRWLVAGVVVAAVVLAVAAVVAFGARSTEDGPYRALLPDEYEARITGCSVFPDGRPNAAGTLSNRSGDRRSMVLEVEVIDTEGVVIDTPRATVVSLDEGATTRWQVRSPYDVGRLSPLTCRISDVFAAAPG